MALPRARPSEAPSRSDPDRTAGLRPAADDDAEASVHSAVQSRDVAQLLRLLARQADPNQVDADGETPLFDAAASGNASLVAALLVNNADPRAESGSGMSARDLAANGRCNDLLELFEATEVDQTPEALARREAMIAELDPPLPAKAI